MGYRLDALGSIPGGGMIISFTQSIPALGLTQPPIRWVPGALFPGAKRLGREAVYSPQSLAGVKNGGSVPPRRHMSSCHGASLRN
jgi:hypothetical protein